MGPYLFSYSFTRAHSSFLRIRKNSRASLSVGWVSRNNAASCTQSPTALILFISAFLVLSAVICCASFDILRYCRGWGKTAKPARRTACRLQARPHSLKCLATAASAHTPWQGSGRVCVCRGSRHRRFCRCVFARYGRSHRSRIRSRSRRYASELCGRHLRIRSLWYGSRQYVRYLRIRSR